MEYKIDHPTLDEEELVLKVSWLFGNPELHHNGSRLLEKSSGTNIYSVKKKDESVVTLALEPKTLDPFPRLEVEGKQHPIGRKLIAIDFVIIALPMLLILVGGAVGGILGFLGTSINARIMRMPKSALERYGLCIASFLAAAVTWYIIALGLNMLFNPQQ